MGVLVFTAHSKVFVDIFSGRKFRFAPLILTENVPVYIRVCNIVFPNSTHMIFAINFPHGPSGNAFTNCGEGKASYLVQNRNTFHLFIHRSNVFENMQCLND